jgi:methylmalonyl-CoA mutase cobalamin-binding subunit
VSGLHSTLRRRTAVVVVAGTDQTSERGGRALAGALKATGVEIVYLGREECARTIAASAAETGADSVEVCVAGGGAAVLLLRALLRELRGVRRPEVSVVVHRCREGARGGAVSE